jgi:antitoxin component of MazEF toxin-antitoxin module
MVVQEVLAVILPQVILPEVAAPMDQEVVLVVVDQIILVQ